MLKERPRFFIIRTFLGQVQTRDLTHRRNREVEGSHSSKKFNTGNCIQNKIKMQDAETTVITKMERQIQQLNTNNTNIILVTWQELAFTAKQHCDILRNN